MDVTGRLRRAAFARPHLLLVAAPAAVEARLAVERYAREHGWPLAESAADSDVLVVVGQPDAGLRHVVTVLERQIPAPWMRADVVDPAAVAATFDPVPARLAARTPPAGHEIAGITVPGGHARHDISADGRRGGHDMGEPGAHAGHHMSGGEGAGPDVGNHSPHGAHGGHHGMGDEGGHESRSDGSAGHGAGTAGHEMAGHEMTGHGGHRVGDDGGHESDGRHGGHEGHDGHEGHGMGGHDHHDMGPVAGLPMAVRAPDRDGLKLDVLHVPLGPVVPFWPAGLRLLLAVQGDVVQEATVEALGVDGVGLPFWDEPVLGVLAGEPTTAGEIARRRAASHLDSLVRLLGVAGWDGLALRCAALRDRALAGESARDMADAFGPLGRKLVGSRVLRRMTEGLGELDGRTCDRAGVSGPAAIAAGDVWARVQQWVRSTRDDLTRLDDHSAVTDVEGPRGRLDWPEPPSAVLLDVLPALLVGGELGGVRLIVASLDPDVAELSLRPAVNAHG